MKDTLKRQEGQTYVFIWNNECDQHPLHWISVCLWILLMININVQKFSCVTKRLYPAHLLVHIRQCTNQKASLAILVFWLAVNLFTFSFFTFARLFAAKTFDQSETWIFCFTRSKVVFVGGQSPHCLYDSVGFWLKLLANKSPGICLKQYFLLQNALLFHC